ncbi:unnamed protein product [Paramecium sonneborni]|uniref:RRM domain-containing protein n=1 Tax=Paramecium sonneborni TaxID=65129 RepID=A0A8S1Q2B9_9CILI|nr:unnamed protein product [Paramecium sonneborni]
MKQNWQTLTLGCLNYYFQDIYKQLLLLSDVQIIQVQSEQSIQELTLESKSKIEIKFTSKLRLITHHISTFKIPHYQLLQHYQHIEKLCLHVSNLSKRVTDAELKETFEKYGQIEYATVCMEPRSKGYPGKVSRGFGFVKFSKKESVQIALESMQDKELHGSKIKVEVSKRAEPRRKTPGRYAGYAYRRSRSRSHRRRRSISSDSYSSSRRRHHRHQFNLYFQSSTTLQKKIHFKIPFKKSKFESQKEKKMNNQIIFQIITISCYLYTFLLYLGSLVHFNTPKKSSQLYNINFFKIFNNTKLILFFFYNIRIYIILYHYFPIQSKITITKQNQIKFLKNYQQSVI